MNTDKLPAAYADFLPSIDGQIEEAVERVRDDPAAQEDIEKMLRFNLSVLKRLNEERVEAAGLAKR